MKTFHWTEDGIRQPKVDTTALCGKECTWDDYDNPTWDTCFEDRDFIEEVARYEEGVACEECVRRKALMDLAEVDLDGGPVPQDPNPFDMFSDFFGSSPFSD